MDKQEAKRALKEAQKNSIQFGLNSLSVKKISEKWITIAESQNGVNHEHRRYDIIGAAKYIDYKKRILSKEVHSIVNENAQSIQWHTQKRTVDSLKSDALEFIEDIFILNALELKYNIDYSNNSVTLNFETGEMIILHVRPEHSTLGLTHTFDLTTIYSQIQHAKLKTVLDFSDLCIGMKAFGIAFRDTVHRLMLGLSQLERFYTVTLTDSDDTHNTLLADITQFISTSAVGDTLSHHIGYAEHNGVTYDRRFQLRKLTRVRTFIEIIAISEERTFVEYRTFISKIGHHITENSQKCLTIHNLLK